MKIIDHGVSLSHVEKKKKSLGARLCARWSINSLFRPIKYWVALADMWHTEYPYRTININQKIRHLLRSYKCPRTNRQKIFFGQLSNYARFNTTKSCLAKQLFLHDLRQTRLDWIRQTSNIQSFSMALHNQKSKVCQNVQSSYTVRNIKFHNYSHH